MSTSTPDLIRRLASVQDAELLGEHESRRARELFERIVAEPRPRRGRKAPRRRRARLVAIPLASLAAVIVAIVLVLGGSHATERASAATALRHVARVAAAQEPLVVGPGQYLYTKSIDAYTTTSVGTTAATTWTALLPQVRETWLGHDGGRLHTTRGTPSFLSERDHARWVAAGRPEVTGSPEEIDLPPLRPVALPDDATTLYAKLAHDTISFGDRQYVEMFTLVGDALRETNATPAQRAALYTVASELPGVDLVGPVKDSLGRAGIAVAMDDEENRMRQTLVFDPNSSKLLEEREVTLARNSFGYPPGTQIGSATYVTQAVVDSKTATP